MEPPRSIAAAAVCLIGLVASLALTGCASSRNYLADRGRDAADILTLSTGTGYGLQLRGGPLQLGWMYSADRAGLRGGVLLDEDLPAAFPPDVGGLVTPLFSVDAFEPRSSGPLPGERGKTWRADGIAIVSRLRDTGNWPYYAQLEGAIGIVGHLRFGLNLGELADFLLGLAAFDLADDDLGAR